MWFVESKLFFKRGVKRPISGSCKTTIRRTVQSVIAAGKQVLQILKFRGYFPSLVKYGPGFVLCTSQFLIPISARGLPQELSGFFVGLCNTTQPLHLKLKAKPGEGTVSCFMLRAIDKQL
jgi:hypothetical protein